MLFITKSGQNEREWKIRFILSFNAISQWRFVNRLPVPYINKNAIFPSAFALSCKSCGTSHELPLVWVSYKLHQLSLSRLSKALLQILVVPLLHSQKFQPLKFSSIKLFLSEYTHERALVHSQLRGFFLNSPMSRFFNFTLAFQLNEKKYG